MAYSKIPLSLLRTLNDHGEDIRAMVHDLNASNDFNGKRYRVIHEDYLEDTMCEELQSDTYVLGCFNADFLANITGLDSDLIAIIQRAEAYDKLGEWMINNGYVEAIATEYIRQDGPGHHFALYDGQWETFGPWHVFRMN